LAIVWIAFPFIVHGLFTKLLKGQARTNELLEYIAERAKERTEIAAGAANAKRLTPNDQRLTEEKKDGRGTEATPKVYKID
jgi:hypothetical protein